MKTEREKIILYLGCFRGEPHALRAQLTYRDSIPSFGGSAFFWTNTLQRDLSQPTALRR